MILSEVSVQGHSCLVLDPPVIPSGAPVVVTLHGLGANADDLVPFCEELKLPGIRFVLPDAPLALPGYPEGSYAWYNFQAHDRKEIEQSRDYLFKVLERFANDPNLRPAAWAQAKTQDLAMPASKQTPARPAAGSSKAPSPLILVGFSQGGVMALEAGLNYKGKIAAIVSMSGYMPDPFATLTRAEAPFETPILLVHGSQDEVVPMEGSQRAFEALQETGYSNVTFTKFVMPHTITEESIQAVREFLQGVLKS